MRLDSALGKASKGTNEVLNMNKQTIQLLEDAITWLIAQYNPSLHDDDLADAIQDPVERERAIREIIAYLLKEL